MSSLTITAPPALLPARGRWPFAGFALFVAGVSAVIWWTGPVPQVMYGSDVANFLDASQRQYLGQVVHRDYFSPLSGVGLLPFSTAMQFTGPTVAALPLGVTLNFLLVATWAWLLARERLAPAFAAVFTVITGLLVAATYALDFGGWENPSYAMYYNRTCWALLGMLALECYVPVPDAGPGRNWRGGISSGAALAGLLLVKVNFFGAGLGIIASSLVLDRHLARRRLLPLVVGFVAATAAGCLLARVDLSGYAREITGMSGAGSLADLHAVLLRVMADNAVWLIAGTILLVGLIRESRLLPEASRAPFRQAIAVYVLVTGAGLAVSVANCQFAELPTFALAVLLLAARLRPLPAGRLPRALGFAALLLGGLYALPHAGMLARAATRQVLVPAEAEANGLRVDLPALRELGLRSWPGDPTGADAADSLATRRDVSPYAFGQWLQDGVALLRPHLDAQSCVLSLDWGNPFPFALGLPPARGDHIAWHYGRIVGESHHPDVGQLVRQADFVMEPKFSIQPDSLAFKRRLFRPWLEESFAPAASSRYWILWQRRSPATTAPAASL